MERLIKLGDITKRDVHNQVRDAVVDMFGFQPEKVKVDWVQLSFGTSVVQKAGIEVAGRTYTVKRPYNGGEYRLSAGGGESDED